MTKTKEEMIKEIKKELKDLREAYDIAMEEINYLRGKLYLHSGKLGGIIHNQQSATETPVVNEQNQSFATNTKEELLCNDRNKSADARKGEVGK